MGEARIGFLAILLCVPLAGQTAEMLAKRSAEAMQIISGAGGGGKVVKDKPYSAEAVTETVQELRDGNRIVRRNVTRLYRDSVGRTRREHMFEALGPSAPVEQRQIVMISDPITKTEYVLDGVTVNKFSRAENRAPAPPKPGGMAEDLGKRIIEGLECTGTRTTVTIPAGQIGNERPIVTVTETWYSPDIELAARSVTSDPRFGTTTYFLRNVLRAEQPAHLFESK